MPTTDCRKLSKISRLFGFACVNQLVYAPLILRAVNNPAVTITWTRLTPLGIVRSRQLSFPMEGIAYHLDVLTMISGSTN